MWKHLHLYQRVDSGWEKTLFQALLRAILQTGGFGFGLGHTLSFRFIDFGFTRGSDAFEEGGSGFVFRVLRNKVASEGFTQEGLSRGAGSVELAVELITR